MSSYRNPATLLSCMNLTTIFGATIYLRSHHIHSLEEHEAWMDETEGTLRSHIGLVEGTLESLRANMPRKEEAMIAPLKGANIHIFDLFMLGSTAYASHTPYQPARSPTLAIAS